MSDTDAATPDASGALSPRSTFRSTVGSGGRKRASCAWAPSSSSRVALSAAALPSLAELRVRARRLAR